jgi:hypothetical protein
MENLLNAMLHHPGAALDHLRAYGQLASAEMNVAMRAWQRRALLAAGAIACGALTFGFLGMALMAWALMPTPLNPSQWLAVAAPAAITALACTTCLIVLSRSPAPAPLRHLSQQWQLDMGWLLANREDAP